MKTLTINDIRMLSPWYDPSEYFRDDWQGTLLDILEIADSSFDAVDRLWTVMELIFTANYRGPTKTFGASSQLPPYLALCREICKALSAISSYESASVKADAEGKAQVSRIIALLNQEVDSDLILCATAPE
ncbi:MAG: hypothetical protein GY753_16990 [Gammaproteobacteria bacterium]|nr:hypothetical protein [Gammaproteobacteria bacterium]